MDREVLRSIKESMLLHKETVKAELDDACFTVALHALGANNHIQDILYGSPPYTSEIVELIERNGLEVTSISVMSGNITGSEVLAVLTNSDYPDHSGRRSKLRGFMGVEIFPGEVGHVIAILPRESLTRIARRELKKHESFMIFDSLLPEGMDYVNVNDLAYQINYTLNTGGKYYILQVRE